MPAGVPVQTRFFGPTMDLSPTASRFDNSISWLAAHGNSASLDIFDDFGADVIYARNRELEAQLRDSLAGVGWEPAALPAANRSTIVSVPLGGLQPELVVPALSQEGVIASMRDGALRLSVHLYNHEDDIDRLIGALGAMDRPVPPADDNRA
jgi:cysteine desulfurase/selenocysteine lyase